MKWEFTSWGELAFDEISNDISSDFFMQFCFFSGKLILIETFCTFQCLLCPGCAQVIHTKYGKVVRKHFCYFQNQYKLLKTFSNVSCNWEILQILQKYSRIYKIVALFTRV